MERGDKGAPCWWGLPRGLKRWWDPALLRGTLGLGEKQQYRMHPGKFRLNRGENVFNMRTF